MFYPQIRTNLKTTKDYITEAIFELLGADRFLLPFLGTGVEQDGSMVVRVPRPQQGEQFYH